MTGSAFSGREFRRPTNRIVTLITVERNKLMGSGMSCRKVRANTEEEERKDKKNNDLFLKRSK